MRTPQDELEQMRRHAMRELSDRNYSGAAFYADELLRAHPTSWVAYWLKGTTAVQTGDGKAAAAAFDRAAEILEREQDRMYVPSRPSRVDETITWLRASARKERERLR